MVFRTGFGPAIATWTRGSTQSADRRFFVATAPMLAANIGYVNLALFIQDSTGDVEVQVAYQEADEPDAFTTDASSFTLVPTFMTHADGVSYDGTWRSVTLTKKYVRFGFAVKNYENTTRDLAYCALRIDTRAP